MVFKAPLLTIEDSDNLHLCFMLDNNTYAINAKNVLEVTTLPLINEPQKMPEYIVGILNYNDLFINVIDIRKILALPQKKYELSNKVIIIKGEESLFSVIVDEITDFFTACPSKVQRVMGENYNGIVRTYYKLNEEIVNIIDIYKIESMVKKAHFVQNTTNYYELFPNDEESLCVLQKRRNDIAKMPSFSIDTGVYGKDQYIVFKVGEHIYCLYSLFARELINSKNYPLTKLPDTPSFISGIINLKGNFYTVLKLKDFIGIEDEQKGPVQSKTDGKIIVIESTELKLALYVDDILNIINIPKDNIEQKSNIVWENMFIKAEAYIDKKVYNILNIDKLIHDNRLYIDNSCLS